MPEKIKFYKKTSSMSAPTSADNGVHFIKPNGENEKFTIEVVDKGKKYVPDYMTLKHPAASVTQTNINNWNTAFGWGNHALAGYLTPTALNNYIPYTGATANVNLGARSITSTGGFIGNASTATTLATSRTINGTSFNGSANITTANWGTARNIKIGNTTKSVNGSGNVSWSLAEIGAAEVDPLYSRKTFTSTPISTTGILKVKIGSTAFSGWVRVRVTGFWSSSNVNGLIEISGGIGANAEGIWSNQMHCVESHGETRSAFYIDPVIKVDTDNQLYFEVHKKSAANNFISVDIETRATVPISMSPSIEWASTGTVITNLTNEVTFQGSVTANSFIKTGGTSTQFLLADGSTAPKSDFGKVDKVMGVEPDADKNVDISGVAMNWTNENQRWSGLVDKSADATYDKVMVLDGEGKAGTKDAGDLGKNFSNTDLEVSENRKHTGTASVELAMPMIYSNASQRFSGLADKSSDKTYNVFPVFDSIGNFAKASKPFHAFKNFLTQCTIEESTELGQLLNGGQGSSGAISVNLISPDVIDNIYDSYEYVVLRGTNLKLNETDMSITICDSSKNVISEIPNSQIINKSDQELIFSYNFKNFPLGDYIIKVTSGVKVYYSGLKLSVMSNLINKDLSSLTWEKIYEDENKIPKLDNAQGNLVSLQTRTDVNTADILTSFKSSEIFAEGEDFIIEINCNIDVISGGAAGNSRAILVGLGYSNTPNVLSPATFVNFSLSSSQSHTARFYLNNNLVTGNLSLPRLVIVKIKKQGNLFTISLDNQVATATFTNNSGYSLFFQGSGLPKGFNIESIITRATKIN